MSMNPWDIKLSMLFSLLLANIRILSCFLFLFLVMLSKFFTIPVVKEKIKLKLSPAIPTRAPTALTEEKIHTSLLVAEKKIKILSM